MSYTAAIANLKNYSGMPTEYEEFFRRVQIEFPNLSDMHKDMLFSQSLHWLLSTERSNILIECGIKLLHVVRYPFILPRYILPLFERGDVLKIAATHWLSRGRVELRDLSASESFSEGACNSSLNSLNGLNSLNSLNSHLSSHLNSLNGHINASSSNGCGSSSSSSGGITGVGVSSNAMLQQIVAEYLGDWIVLIKKALGAEKVFGETFEWLVVVLSTLNRQIKAVVVEFIAAETNRLKSLRLLTKYATLVDAGGFRTQIEKFGGYVGSFDSLASREAAFLLRTYQRYHRPTCTFNITLESFGHFLRDIYSELSLAQQTKIRALLQHACYSHILELFPSMQFQETDIPKKIVRAILMDPLPNPKAAIIQTIPLSFDLAFANNYSLEKDLSHLFSDSSCQNQCMEV
ncbi:hypothetical protein NEHOM01_0503 [Nematocida homosporus]|uniref:uncharacterized protein n=1 Tax=Nematocida homosporus TaxID=1912981 RepID=UPI00221F763C|nr:uncharacterized protein NEHOM01_0503 [Nematocida homosporus]KAI5184952.1 hypothetical protein NEHOM01_0503 [Nematocida homosporus]